MNLSFEEAAFGTEREIEFLRTENCTTCDGVGAPKDAKESSCAKCGGKGTVTFTARTLFGQQLTSRTCEDCSSKGKAYDKKCDTCKGHGIVKKNAR